LSAKHCELAKGSSYTTWLGLENLYIHARA
jgi:hypothetical protein